MPTHDRTEALLRVDRQPLPSEVADRLRSAITSGRLKPGERLIEHRLAEQLGVSRSPLREALQQLTREGLAVALPYRGVLVAELTPTDIDEIYTMRLALERLAIQRVIAAGSQDHIDALNGVVAAIREAQALGSRELIPQLDLRFHQLICQFSSHERLFGAWQNLGNQLRSFLTEAEPLYSDTEMVSRHALLVDAIKARDSDRATLAIEEHITTASRLIMGRDVH